MIFWRFRHELPFAAMIGIGGRKDIPVAMRARFEDASALLEEARRILRSRRRETERELTASEREQLNQTLTALERTMTSNNFDAAAFDAAHARADRSVGEHLSRWRKGEMREYAESIGIAVAVALYSSARSSSRPFKIPRRLDDPDADGRRPHLRQQVHLRSTRSLDQQAACSRACRRSAAT